MSTLSQLVGGTGGPVASVVNGSSSGTRQTLSSNGTIIGTKALASGALTAATLATALSITGRGRLNFASAIQVDATSRTVRLKITIDGVSIFDATTSAGTSLWTGLLGVGIVTSAGYAGYQPVEFNSSCLVEVASSLTETDKIQANVAYEVWS